MKLMQALVLLAGTFAGSAQPIIEIEGRQDPIDEWCHSIEIGRPSGPKPESLSAAAEIIHGLISAEDRLALVKLHEELGSCPRQEAKASLRAWAKRYWKLNQQDSRLARNLAWIGLHDFDAQLDVILASIATLEMGDQVDEDRLRRFLFLQEQDLAEPRPELPTACNGKTIDKSGAESFMLNDYMRQIRFVRCGPSVYFYRWEQGWYVPDDSEMSDFCNQTDGDSRRICPEVAEAP